MTAGLFAISKYYQFTCNLRTARILPHAVFGRLRWRTKFSFRCCGEAGDDPVIAITHTPDIFTILPENILLTLAGHTRGGQVYIPLVGRPVVPSEFGERYAIGHIREKGHSLFVSAGVGTSIFGVRFLTPPEINILTLVHS